MLPNDLDRANELIQAGRTDQAMALLARILKNEPRNELAWVLLASCVDDELKQMDCLERVLSINPKNKQALVKYNRLKRKQKKASLSAADSRKASVSKKSSTNNSQEGREASVPQDEPSKPRRRTKNTTVEVEQNAEPLGRKSAKSSTTTPKSTSKPKSTSSRSAGKKSQKAAAGLSGKTKSKAKTKTSQSGTTETKLSSKSDDAQINSAVDDLKSAWDEQLFLSARGTIKKIDEPELPYQPPEHVRFNPEADFFYGMREGVVLSSRLESGVFGKAVFIDGLRIYPDDYPACLGLGKDFDESYCEYCEHFSPKNCLLRFDTYLMEDIRRINAIRAERIANLIRRQKNITLTIHEELKSHGRPLHYSVVARIMMKRYPHFKLTEASIYHYINWHTELFERVDTGVYRAK
ncbi:MAG TPA: tetratricopeptide repeat protein [Anaerolineaceae bacterium]|nr:tetratricopeptide repeat protein [Anaerolineaceae bacterium]